MQFSSKPSCEDGKPSFPSRMMAAKALAENQDGECPVTETVSSSRAIARAVLSWPFEPVALAAQTNREAVSTALDGYRKAMIPMHKMTKGERIEDQRSLAKLIRSIGLRIRPDFTEDQAQMWIAAMVEALEDQPARIAILATKDAQRHPMQFPGEVLKVILEKAEPHRLTYQRAIRNLEKLLKEIDQPMLEASTNAKTASAQISDDELQEMSQPLRQLGIRAGFLVEESDSRIRWASDDEQEAHKRRLETERQIARARETGKE